MRWDDFRRSSNVEDDRGASMGGGFGMPGGAHGLGIGTIIILGLVGWALGIDPSVLINGAEILSGGGSGRAAKRSAARGRCAHCRDQGFHRRGARRHRGPLDRHFHGYGAHLPSGAAAAL